MPEGFFVFRSAYEVVMLLCFGAAWPFSIYRSLKSRSTKGKSISFMVVISFGYVAGIFHKIFYFMDFVIVFYALNLLMISIDMVLYFRNRKRELAQEQ